MACFVYASKFNSDVSDRDVSSVTNMNGMYAHCDVFNTSYVSDWEVETATLFCLPWELSSCNGTEPPGTTEPPGSSMSDSAPSRAAMAPAVLGWVALAAFFPAL